MTPVRVRWIIKRDMPEVMAIESASFPNPWTEQELLDVLRVRNCIGLVAEHDEQVLGYLLYTWQKRTVTLVSMAVHPEYRRQGVGSRLIDRVISKLSDQRRRACTLIVRETNLPAQLFFRSQQFRAVRVLRAEYEDTDEDGYLMERAVREEASV